jgi:hypothetical protein
MAKREATLTPDHQVHPEPSGQPIQTLKRNLKKQKSELEKLMADLRKAIKPSQRFWTRYFELQH